MFSSLMAGRPSWMTTVLQPFLRCPGSVQRTETRTCTGKAHQSHPPTCRYQPHFHNTARDGVCVCVSPASVPLPRWHRPQSLYNLASTCWCRLCCPDGSAAPCWRRIRCLPVACFPPVAAPSPSVPLFACGASSWCSIPCGLPPPLLFHQRPT